MNKDSNFKNNSILPSLYRLIKSLSQTQKRDFKKYARFWSTGKAQKYIGLFDHINRYVISSKEITNLVNDLAESRKFGTGASTNTLAHYLFDKIMESIRGTPGTIPPRHNKLFQAFYDIHFLFYKELYAECYKAIREAKKLAYEMDRPVYLLELQIWEARITGRLGHIPWRLSEMEDELQQTLRIVELTYTTFLNAQQILIAAKTNDTGLLSKEIKGLVENVRNRQEDSMEEISPRLHYWRLVELQHYFELQYIIDCKSAQVESSEKNLSGVLEQLKTNLDFMSEKGKVIAEEEPVIYTSALENYLARCLQLKDKAGIEKMESVFINYEDKKDEIHRYRSIVYYKILSYISFNQFRDACLYLEGQQLEENLQSRQHLISDNRMSAIRYCCVQAYFLNENYEMALKWTNHIINNPRSQSLPMTFLMSELIQSICRLELKKIRNSGSNLETLIRKYKRREPKNKFLHNLLLALKYAAMPPQSTLMKEIVKRRNKLEPDLNKNNALLVYGPILAWLDSRISGKTLAVEILKYNP